MPNGRARWATLPWKPALTDVFWRYDGRNFETETKRGVVRRLADLPPALESTCLRPPARPGHRGHPGAGLSRPAPAGIEEITMTPWLIWRPPMNLRPQTGLVVLVMLVAGAAAFALTAAAAAQPDLGPNAGYSALETPAQRRGCLPGLQAGRSRSPSLKRRAGSPRPSSPPARWPRSGPGSRARTTGRRPMPAAPWTTCARSPPCRRKARRPWRQWEISSRRLTWSIGALITRSPNESTATCWRFAGNGWVMTTPIPPRPTTTSRST